MTSPISSSRVLRLPTDVTNGDDVMALGTPDMTNRGRSMPMMWIYKDTLDSDKLIEALNKTLPHYPVLCGRYSSSPMSMDLNNLGVPVEVCHMTGDVTEVAAHVLPSAAPGQPDPVSFSRQVYAKFMPSVMPKMDPDSGNPEAPVLAVRIMLLQPGTIVSVLLQHGVCDGEAMVSFMVSWSRIFRGLPLDGAHAPNHERGFIQSSGEDKDAKIDNLCYTVTPKGETPKNNLFKVMPKVMGDGVCVVPISKTKLAQLKATGSAGLPVGKFVSTDDVLTALVWRTMCKIRCKQLDITLDSLEQTTCLRALNVRSRLDPPLKSSYCGNAVFPVWINLSVKDIMSKSLADVALILRSNVQEWNSQRITTFLKWQNEHMKSGAKVSPQFDSNGLTFLVSSWIFQNAKWEDVDFGVKPICFDHVAHVPVVSVFSSRAGGDGVNVWTSGTTGYVEEFMEGIHAAAE